MYSDIKKKNIIKTPTIFRAISYPFNAKQPNDMSKRHQKVTKEGLEKLRSKVDVSILNFCIICTLGIVFK